MVIIYLCGSQTCFKVLRACVRASMRDAIVPRFNLAAESARTVGFRKRDSARTVGFGKRDSARTVEFGNQVASAREISEEPGNEHTKERFDFERERDWVWDRRRRVQRSRRRRNCKQPCEEGIGSRQVFL